MATRPKPKENFSRSAAPRNFWTGAKKTIKHVAMDDFRISTLRRSKPHMLLAGGRVTVLAKGRFVREFAGLVESISWFDESAILTGEMTLREPAYSKHPLDIIDGDEVLLEYAPSGGKFVELFRMRAKEPSYNLDSGGLTIRMENELGNLAGSLDDFKYKKTKTKKGWLFHEVIVDVCAKYAVKLGKVARGRFLIKNYVKLAYSPFEVIKDVLTKEATNEKRKFVIRYHRGKLHILPLTRNPQLLELGPLIQSAAFSKQRKKRTDETDAFATAVTVRGKNWQVAGTDTKKAKKLKGTKLHVLVVSKAAVARFGYVHKILYSPDATSVAELRAQGQAYLTECAKADKTLTLTHPGIPTLRRGHALKVFLPQEGLNQVVYVKTARFQLSPASFTMDLELFFDDPYIDRKKQLITDKLTDSPRETEAKSTKTKRKAAPKPETAAVRAAAIKPVPSTTNAERLAGKFGG